MKTSQLKSRCVADCIADCHIQLTRLDNETSTTRVDVFYNFLRTSLRDVELVEFGH